MSLCASGSRTAEIPEKKSPIWLLRFRAGSARWQPRLCWTVEELGRRFQEAGTVNLIFGDIESWMSLNPGHRQQVGRISRMPEHSRKLGWLFWEQLVSADRVGSCARDGVLGPYTPYLSCTYLGNATSPMTQVPCLFILVTDREMGVVLWPPHAHNSMLMPILTYTPFTQTQY